MYMVYIVSSLCRCAYAIMNVETQKYFQQHFGKNGEQIVDILFCLIFFSRVDF